MSKVVIHDNGIFKDIVTGEVLGMEPHKFLSVGDKYIDKNNIECTIVDKQLLPTGHLMVRTVENSAPLAQQQIINLATKEYESIPEDVKKKITLWDKVKGWFK